MLFFSGDGKYRSRIGISPRRAKPFLGSYDAANQVLTIVHLTIPENAADYVNSMWQIQDNPFGGDEKALGQIVQLVLGVGLEEIKSVF